MEEGLCFFLKTTHGYATDYLISQAGEGLKPSIIFGITFV